PTVPCGDADHGGGRHRDRREAEQRVHGTGEGSSGWVGGARIPNVSNGQYRSHARPMTALTGTVPNARESADFSRWSPMTKRSPVGTTQRSWPDATVGSAAPSLAKR